MTGEPSGKDAGGVLATLRRLREHWLLIVALASALFWARDLVATYARLPDEIDRQGRAVAELSTRISGLEIRLLGAEDAAPAAAGTLSGPPAGRAGRWTQLVWRSLSALEPGCMPRSLSAVLVDASGRWHALEAEIDRPSGTAAGPGLAFRVRPHARMGVGHARLRLRAGWSCAGQLRDDLSPWLPFVLLGD